MRTQNHKLATPAVTRTTLRLSDEALEGLAFCKKTLHWSSKDTIAVALDYFEYGNVKGIHGVLCTTTHPKKTYVVFQDSNDLLNDYAEEYGRKKDWIASVAVVLYLARQYHSAMARINYVVGRISKLEMMQRDHDFKSGIVTREHLQASSDKVYDEISTCIKKGIAQYHEEVAEQENIANGLREFLQGKVNYEALQDVRKEGGEESFRAR